jgi:hypothetical protein
MGQELIMGEEKQFFMLLADPIRFSGDMMRFLAGKAESSE